MINMYVYMNRRAVHEEKNKVYFPAVISDKASGGRGGA